VNEGVRSENDPQYYGIDGAQDVMKGHRSWNASSCGGQDLAEQVYTQTSDIDGSFNAFGNAASLSLRTEGKICRGVLRKEGVRWEPDTREGLPERTSG
jgi:hypothetical protein